MQDSFALNLAVGVKDVYSRKIDELDAKTQAFQARTKDLQKTVADVQAYRQAEAAMDGLEQKQASLSSELDGVSGRKKALIAQVDKLKKSMAGQGKETLEGKKALHKLEQEIVSLEDKEGDLRAELASTTAEQNQNLSSLKKLSRGLSDAGLDTRDLTGELKKLEAELDDVAKAEKKTSGMSLGAGLAGGAAVAGAGAFVGSLAKGVYEYDTALSHLAATTTLTKEQAESMKPALRDVYVQTGKSVQEIAPALQLVVQQLGLTGGAATDAVMALMEFSNVHPEMDTTEVVKAAGQAKKAWGLSTRETLDLISTITEQAGDKADDLLDTFWEYGPTMKEAGLSAKQFSAMLISGAQAGAMNFDKIADSVKEAWKARISDIDMWDSMMGSGDKEGSIDEILDRFGMEEAGARIKGQLGQLRQGLLTGNDALKSEAWGGLMTEMSALYEKDAQAARNITEQIFGTQGSEDMTAQVLGAMGKGLQSSDVVMAGSMGASNRQFAETLTLVDHLGQSWRSVKSVFAQGAGDIAKSLAPVGKALAKIASGIASFAKEHPGVAKFVTLMAGAVAVAGTLAAGLAAVGFVVSGIATGLATVGPVLAGLATGFSVAGKAALFLGKGFMALAMNPVGAVIMAVAGAAFLVWKYWDKITEGVKTAFGWISKLGGYLASGLKMAWDFSPLGMLWNMGKKVVDFFSNIDLSESGAKLLKTLASGITSAVTAPFRALKSGLSKLRNLLPFSDAKEGPLSSLTESGRKVLETMGTGIKAAGPGLAKTAKGALAGTAAVLAVGAGGVPAGAAVPDGIQTPTARAVQLPQDVEPLQTPTLPDLLGRGAYAVDDPESPVLPDLLARGKYEVTPPQAQTLPDIDAGAGYDVRVPDVPALPDLLGRGAYAVDGPDSPVLPDLLARAEYAVTPPQVETRHALSLRGTAGYEVEPLQAPALPDLLGRGAYAVDGPDSPVLPDLLARGKYEVTPPQAQTLPDIDAGAGYDVRPPDVPALPDLLGRGAYAVDGPDSPVLPDLLGRGGYAVTPPQAQTLPDIDAGAGYDVRVPDAPALPDLLGRGAYAVDGPDSPVLPDLLARGKYEVTPPQAQTLPDIDAGAGYDVRPPDVPALPDLLGRGAYAVDGPDSPVLPDLLARGKYEVTPPQAQTLPDIDAGAGYDVRPPDVPALPDLLGRGAYTVDGPDSPVLPDLLARAEYAVTPPQVEALQNVEARHALSPTQAGREVTVNLTYSPVVNMESQSPQDRETLEQALNGQSVEMMTALERAVTEIMERYDQRSV